MTPAQVERARQVAEVAQQWEVLASLHRTEFAAATEPPPPTAEPVPRFEVLLDRAEKKALRGVRLFDRTGRREARRRARTSAEDEARKVLAAARAQHRARVAEAAAEWQALMAGDPEVMVSAVRGALARRGVRGSVVSGPSAVLILRVEVPGAEELPSHVPAWTASGAPTLKKLNKTQLAERVRHLVAARVLLAAKETLAVAPACHVVEVEAALVPGEPVLRARLGREPMTTASWALDAWDVLEEVDPDLEVNVGGRTRELRPLPS